MLFSRCQRILVRAAAVALALCVATSSVVEAKPRPDRPKGFRLMASAVNLFTVNRVQCRVFSDGGLCNTGSSTVGGGIWPRGSADQYVFGSGINIAGVIESGDRSVNGFAGDTAGGFFNNTAGGGNGTEVRPIFSSSDASDVAVWPDEARVPLGDASENLFDPTLRGSIAASQGDLWFVSWEGDPSQLASRAHPLGVAVETRVMAWNFPSGNEDIMYVIYTFYNVTSTDPAHYAAVRPSLRPLLLQKAADFQAANTAKYGINLPPGGYTINDLYAAFTADMDVATADANYAAVNVPFALGYTYENHFGTAADLGWTFDPAIFGSAPFFAGIGFVGVKFLGSPVDPATGEPVGLSLFGTFSRSSGSLQDPNDDKQLYRYITGRLTPIDGACSLPDPVASKICFVNISSPADMRFFQSSGPIDLAPGGFGSITVAYIFAAPVSVPGCPGVGCDVKPANSNADLTILGDPARMASGVNTIDIITGYLGNTNADPTRVPADPDPTRVTQDEFITQPGSLLGKALIAQSVFDNKFLLPFAPTAPEFFLVPGDNQVTVLWSPSATETTPDPFFNVASQPLIGGSPNPLYDPNFRGLDVEGYRVYRGRTSNPSELTLVAQFDKEGTVFSDFRGTVNPTPGCAPELGVNNLSGCGTVFTVPAPGEAFLVSRDFDLSGQITQVVPGNRVLLADGSTQILPGALDTAFTDITSGKVGQGVLTDLRNTGVPFLFIDRGVRNSLRYFYTVTAFDVNSLSSGPASLESGRITKQVTPAPTPSNQVVASNLVTHTIGRGVAMDTIIDTLPTLDPATGKFSGPFPPANGGIIGFVGEFAASIIQPSQSGALTMRLDSLQMGKFEGVQAVFGVTTPGPVPTQYYVTVGNGVDSFKVTIPHTQALFSGGGAVGVVSEGTEESSAFFQALTVAPATAQRFEGSPPFVLQGQATVRTGPGQENGGWGVGSRFGDFAGIYNGARWFDGPTAATNATHNETKDNPNIGNCTGNPGASTALLTPADCGAVFADVNNAGALTGVTTIQQALSYININGAWRNFDWLFPTVHRAADFNVYWGPAGVVDSVIDVTHNVVVPFETYMGGGWGILNTSAGSTADTRAAVLSMADIGCVQPFHSGPVAGESSLRIPCTLPAPLPFSNTAALGSVAFFRNLSEAGTVAPAAEGGFLFYIAGSVFMMSMPALPADDAVWALRTYSGTIEGGPGSYSFNPPAVRPFTAIGATAALEFGVSSTVASATKDDLSRVHTVPDPYYVRSKYEASTEQKVLKFVGLPQDAIVRIYSASGVLVRLLEHRGSQYASTSSSQGSEMDWDLRNRNNQVVASGVYFYHVEAGDARRVGRFTVVNFAQ
jgi:hypothetical protein